MAFVIALFLFCLCFASCSDACGLGYTISSIAIQTSGDYKVECSAKAYPICPESCYWTNDTCDEFAKRKSWSPERHILTNMTYSYPVHRQGRRLAEDEIAERGTSKTLPRKIFTVSMTTSKNVQLTTSAPKVKSVRRKCCSSPFLNISQCKSVDWKPDASNGNKFDVAAYAKKNLKCQRDDAVVRDIKVKNLEGNQLSIDVCCLNYSNGAKGVVACVRGKHGAGVTTIEASAAAFPLALGLGIGIPLLLSPAPPDDCHSKFNIIKDIYYHCSRYARYDGLSENQCCVICLNTPGESGCQFFHDYFHYANAGCFVCFDKFTKASGIYPGIINYFPK